MIFNSQSGITDPTRAADWDRWYIEHLRIMASVPGVTSAQRFKTDAPGFSPSLAMYTMAGPQVFEDAYYQKIRGLGEFLPLIDRRYYKRNLFEGLDEAPVVSDHEHLLVCDASEPGGLIGGVPFTWLKCVGVDRSTPYRGVAVVPAARTLDLGPDVIVYRPVTPRVTPNA